MLAGDHLGGTGGLVAGFEPVGGVDSFAQDRLRLVRSVGISLLKWTVPSDHLTVEASVKAITYRSYGPPEVLRLGEVDKPVPRDDEVLVRVMAAEATKSDVEMRRSRFAVKWFWLPLRIASGIRKPRKPILGGYFSGEIAALGRHVADFQVGQPVFGAAGLRFGAYAEYVALPASYPIATKPANMSFIEAAAVPLGGFNALHFLQLARIEAAEKVLINGAGGSIGTHAIQIAKSMGAQVTAVDSAIKAQMLTGDSGADHFIDHADGGFAVMDQAYDVIRHGGGQFIRCEHTALQCRVDATCRSIRLSVMLRSVLTTGSPTRRPGLRLPARPRRPCPSFGT
ncbi:MAG: NAD(P)-dependent alcohol dehydrogenase [Burkholderiaceae bacterium]